MKTGRRRLSLLILLSLLFFLFSLSPASLTESHKLGDVDGNGLINALDARLALRIVHSLEHNISSAALIAADFNQDKYITLTDAQLILRFSAGLDPHPDEAVNDSPDAVLSSIPEDTSKGEPADIPSTPKPTSPFEVDEIRGVWVTSVLNLDFPSSPNLSIDRLRQELDDIIKNTKNWGLNTVFFQVRPSSDALYRSEIYPVSKFLSTDENFLLQFDPLEYIIEKAHSAGLGLHAWINPLRITTGSPSRPEHDLSLLPSNSPAYKNPNWTVSYADGKLYFDPAYPQLRQLVTESVLEIIRNYDVDGIHFDDYFYPYPVSEGVFDDSKSYASYGNGRSIEDFRRDNTNALIAQVYKAIKTENEQLLFGISPFAVWRNKATDPLGSDTKAGIESYDDIYADSRKWIKEGSLDYVCPQIYWSMEQDAAEYRKVFDWWNACVEGTEVKLLVGHGLHKVGGSEKGWENPQELLRQIQYATPSQNYGGSVFFRYNYLVQNPLGITEKLRDYYSQN